MDKIKEIMKDQIETFKEWKRFEASGQVDSEWCYDETWGLFQKLDRDQCLAIMEELIKD